MDFHETDIGKQFLNIQFPKLIGILEKIAESLSGKPIPDMVSMDLPENYLEDLYYGNLEIGAYTREDYDSKNNEKIIKVQEQLKAQLTEEQWKIFERYSILVNNGESEECFRMFQHGYRTAIRFIMAGMSQSVGEKPKEK